MLERLLAINHVLLTHLWFFSASNRCQLACKMKYLSLIYREKKLNCAHVGDKENEFNLKFIKALYMQKKLLPNKELLLLWIRCSNA